MVEDLFHKVHTKDIDAVYCDNINCSIIGDYWKCYTHKHKDCKVYQDYLKYTILHKYRSTKKSI